MRCNLVVLLTLALWLLVLTSLVVAQSSYFDRSFPSNIFQEERHYRIFLPPSYDSGTDEKRYPVIYYFHGHSDRYTLEHYDNGEDTVPKINRFVAKNDVIVVTVDGYVEEHYEGFYGGSPWDVRQNGGDYDFGDYFLEMVAHVDANYRTRSTRRYRATSGLSMGGFMSFYLSARFPDLIGSASVFNPGPEFYVGDKGSRMLWRPKDHVSCHNHSMIRLVRASGDYISQYHEETRAAYVHEHSVDFEYRVDDYHRHWATSIGETFAFHMRAFDNVILDSVPDRWQYASAFRNFQVWDYDLHVTGKGRAFVYLTDVQAGGLRVTTRLWAPDGPPASDKKISIVTSPQYKPLESYEIVDFSLAKGVNTKTNAKADVHGRLNFLVDGSGHQISVIGPDIAPPRVVLLPLTQKDYLRLWPNKMQSLPIRIHNPSNKPMRNIRVELSSEYPTVEWQKNSTKLIELKPGEVADVGTSLKVRFLATDGYFARTRLQVTLSADGQPQQSVPFDVLIIPEQIPLRAEIEILDGRTVTFSVFRQKGNQGGGKAIERTVTEGKGNGDGILQPGEEATIWVKVAQGLDPRDKNNWHRTKVYTDSPWLVESGDIQEKKQREWTGAQERTSVLRLASEVPSWDSIPVLLDNETWSFRYTPDVRFGRERLYQAFQEHRHHLHQAELKIEKSQPAGP